MFLSLDLSTKSSGWAVFEDTKLVEYGCITSAYTDLIKRIHIMTDGIKEVLNKYEIKNIYVEEVRPDLGSGNLATHRALMYLQAALEFLVHDEYKGTKIEYIYPSSWRAICGIKNGRGVKRLTLKELDKQFVKDNYGLDVNDDIADAICVGHAQVKKQETEINWE